MGVGEARLAACFGAVGLLGASEFAVLTADAVLDAEPQLTSAIEIAMPAKNTSLAIDT
jgi:hypothetical protein